MVTHACWFGPLLGIAFAVLRLLGVRATMLVLGLMAVTALLSMWVSNTASTLTLYPVALSVLALARAGVPAEAHRDGTYRNFAHALLLGVAYAASIGGLATVIGTPRAIKIDANECRRMCGYPGSRPARRLARTKA